MHKQRENRAELPASEPKKQTKRCNEHADHIHSRDMLPIKYIFPSFTWDFLLEHMGMLNRRLPKVG